eukprot:gb/GECH01012189.1/.p1 GENE.gb/GECH01012189.1/~~gb/GECH01012189.1/.p1  ORF type:complete len:420 (+),score=119.38 gb/GECH01012189.1/:1-1260(+)
MVLFLPKFMLPETIELRFEKTVPYAEKMQSKKAKKKKKAKKSKKKEEKKEHNEDNKQQDEDNENHKNDEPESDSDEEDDEEDTTKLPTLMFLKKATQVRNRVKNALARSHNYDEMLKVIEDYLPYVWTITESCYDQAKTTSTWATAFMQETGLFSKRIKYTATGIGFEWIMLLWTKALALNNEAAKTIETAYDAGADLGDARKLATGNLKKAAGIVERILDYELPRFENDSDNIPPEINPANAHIFVSYFCGMAQVIAVDSAVASEKSNELISRLCVGVYQQFDEANTNLDVLKDDVSARIVTNLPQSIAFYRIMYRCEAFKYMAKGCMKDEESGDAVAFIDAARTQGKELKKFESKGGFKKYARSYRDELEDMYEHFNKENSLVYHKSVPATIRDRIPEPISMMKPIPFSAPNTITDI